MSDDLKVIEQESIKKNYVVNGREIFIGKLSFIQVSRLLKALAKIFVKNSEKFKDLKSGETNKDDILNILDKLDETELLEVIAVITGLSVDECKEIEFAVFAEILETIIDFNYKDFQAILKNWQGIASKFKAEQTA